jgi:hypothetical protein
MFWQPFFRRSNKMAESDLEIDVTDVEDGVEVQTIIQGQAPVTGAEDDLEFMIQEEVETTTEGDTLTVELDPVDNVIIALQDADPHLKTGGHFDLNPDDQNGSSALFRGELSVRGESVGASPGKRKRALHTRNVRASGGTAKKRPRKAKKGSIRFTNRQIPAALSGAGVAKDAVREANELSFDPDKEPRKWKKCRIPVKTVDGGRFSVSMWCSGRSMLTASQSRPLISSIGLA